MSGAAPTISSTPAAGPAWPWVGVASGTVTVAPGAPDR